MILLTIIYIKGLFNLIYGIDASIYASLSREMLETGNWLEIFHKGNDYLDKPPLHFWLVASSYKLFGFSSFAYKLPSLLFTFLGVFSTYKLGQLLYNKEVGKLASLLYYSCFAIVLINQDVRTDTILVGISVFSLWKIIHFIRTNSTTSLIFGFIGIGLAMLAKGPIGLMVPVLALGTEFLLKKQWSNIFKWQWIIGLIITGIIISPMLYGLYTQFDLQPTKEFHLSSGMEVKGLSGLKFYFWDQSFGRITGDNMEWKNDSSPLFFTHTYLWSFLPWSIIGLFALGKKIKQSYYDLKNQELFTLGAIILPLIAFSLSSYKLPHYIYVCFPFWFILSANYLINIKKPIWIKTNTIIQKTMVTLLIIGGFTTLFFLFPSTNWLIMIIAVLLFIAVVFAWIKLKELKQLLYVSILGISFVCFIFNFHFMPSVTKYDGVYQAAQFSRKLDINHLYTNNEMALTFDVYSNVVIEYKNIDKLHDDTSANNYVFISEPYLEEFETKYTIKNKYLFKHKGLTSLTLPFLNPTTRNEQLSNLYLIEI